MSDVAHKRTNIALLMAILALSATTIESASRCISSWKRRGLLTPQPAGYLLHDVAALKTIAAGA